MWASKSSGLGGAPPHISTAPIAMCPFDFSLVRKDVSNDVSLSIWRWATGPSFRTPGESLRCFSRLPARAAHRRLAHEPRRGGLRWLRVEPGERRRPAGLLPRFPGQLAGDDLGDAVAAHADAVEDV